MNHFITLLNVQIIFIGFQGTFIHILIFEYFFLFQFRYKAYHNKENQMQDKNTLINSMNNLIKYFNAYVAILASAVEINNKCLQV